MFDLSRRRILWAVVALIQIKHVLPMFHDTGQQATHYLETFMGVEQRTGAGSKPRISRVVSKPDSNHWSGYYGHRILGLTPAGTICRSTRSLGYYPLQIRSTWS